MKTWTKAQTNIIWAQIRWEEDNGGEFRVEFSKRQQQNQQENNMSTN